MSALEWKMKTAQGIST